VVRIIFRFVINYCDVMKNKLIKKDYRKGALTVLLVLFVAVVSFAVGTTFSGSFVANSAPVYNSSGDNWVASGTASSGITFIADSNTVCFPRGTGHACDVNIQWNGTDMIINGPA